MEENKQLEIELSKDMAQGTYANLTIITHSPSEFVLDFIAHLPGIPKPEVKSRVVMTPENAKRLLHALHDNIRKYERDNGEIKLDKYLNNTQATTMNTRGDA